MRQEIHEATRPIERSSLGAAALPPTRARVWGRQAGNQCDASLQLFASLQLLRKSVIWNDHLIIRVDADLVGAFFIEREMRARRAKLAGNAFAAPCSPTISALAGASIRERLFVCDALLHGFRRQAYEMKAGVLALTTLAPNLWSSKQTARAFRIYAFFSPTTCVAAHFDGDGNQLTASPRPTPSSPPAQGGTRVAAARACRYYDNDNARIEQPASRRKRPARHTLRFCGQNLPSDAR